MAAGSHNSLPVSSSSRYSSASASPSFRDESPSTSCVDDESAGGRARALRRSTSSSSPIRWRRTLRISSRRSSTMVSTLHEGGRAAAAAANDEKRLEETMAHIRKQLTSMRHQDDAMRNRLIAMKMTLQDVEESVRYASLPPISPLSLSVSSSSTSSAPPLQSESPSTPTQTLDIVNRSEKIDNENEKKSLSSSVDSTTKKNDDSSSSKMTLPLSPMSSSSPRPLPRTLTVSPHSPGFGSVELRERSRSFTKRENPSPVIIKKRLSSFFLRSSGRGSSQVGGSTPSLIEREDSVESGSGTPPIRRKTLGQWFRKKFSSAEKPKKK